MTPEELKEKWHSLDDDTKRGMRSGGSSEPPFYRDPMVDKVTSGRVISARDRLMANYRKMFAVVAPVGILTAMPLFRLLPWWAVSLIMLFFVIAAMMDVYLYRGIRSIDLWADGVKEVARKARFYRRRHHLFQMLLIPYAAGIVTIYYLSFGEEAMKWGLTVGLIFGLGVGLTLYLRMMRDYKRML